MTLYQIAWQKKRTRRSFLAAFLLHLFVIGGLLLYGLLFSVDLEDFSGPVLIKLGEPEGADLPLPPPQEERPEPEETLPDLVETPEEAPDARDASIPEERPVTEPDRIQPAPRETPAVSETNTAESAAAAPAVPEQPAEPEPVMIRGEESGNAHETVFATEEGQVGRNIWIPINLYMPLPVDLENRYVDNILGDALNTPEEYRRILLRYYRESPLGGYLLESSVADAMSFDERRTLWVLLERGGYDLSQAEYKQGRVLRPVILSFAVLPETGQLAEVNLERSSGYSDLDEAVLYGFRASSYFNSTSRKIKGRFTYRFD